MYFTNHTIEVATQLVDTDEELAEKLDVSKVSKPDNAVLPQLAPEEEQIEE